jgi:hypothetical protein
MHPVSPAEQITNFTGVSPFAFLRMLLFSQPATRRRANVSGMYLIITANRDTFSAHLGRVAPLFFRLLTKHLHTKLAKKGFYIWHFISGFLDICNCKIVSAPNMIKASKRTNNLASQCASHVPEMLTGKNASNGGGITPPIDACALFSHRCRSRASANRSNFAAPLLCTVGDILGSHELLDVEAPSRGWQEQSSVRHEVLPSFYNVDPALVRFRQGFSIPAARSASPSQAIAIHPVFVCCLLSHYCLHCPPAS